MIEFRWKIEERKEYFDGLPLTVEQTEPPVLQFRVEEGPSGKQGWGDWQDVPTVYIET